MDPVSLGDKRERGARPDSSEHVEGMQFDALAVRMYRIAGVLRSPRPYLALIGFGVVLGFWYLTVDVLELPRFGNLPQLTLVLSDWFSKDPAFGLSIYTADYYLHIWASLRRVLIAFGLATALGVPLGLMLGWSRTFKGYIFPIFEIFRPIPALAWVPLAIIMFATTESAILYLTFLPAFFATTLNTMLGVDSLDESHLRAAQCLGARRWQVFYHVVIPGALPFIFTGLQISMGVAWFSLVAGEMIAGKFGLGYVIYTGYTLLSYTNIVIGMITLGIVGYMTSALVRLVGDYLMRWRVREMG